MKMLDSAREGKVCEICGSSGFVEDLATCNHCKRASEHVYCMKILQFKVPDVWYCVACQLYAEITFERKAQYERKKRMHMKDSSYDQERTKFGDDKSTVSCNNPDKPEGNNKELDGTPSASCFNGSSLKKKTDEIRNSSKWTGDKHPKQPLSRGKPENIKVKFISPEEIALSPHTGSCRKKVNFSALKRKQDNREVTPPPPSLRAKVTNVNTNILCHPKEGSKDVEADLLLENPDKTLDNARLHKKHNIHIHKESEAAAGTPVERKTKDRLADEINSPIVRDDRDIKSKGVDLKTPRSYENEKLNNNETSGNKKGSWTKEIELEVVLPINLMEGFPSCSTSGVCWKGSFKVADDIFLDIQAHFPQHVSSKVYEISKKLPDNLQLNMLPRSNAWPNTFQLDCPDYNDIGLLFLPSSLERTKGKYNQLVEQNKEHDFAMSVHIDDVELLIYSSNVLNTGSQRIDGQAFLWGIFRHLKGQKYTRREQEKCPPGSAVGSMIGEKTNIACEENSEEAEMEIDMIGGKEIGSIDIPLLRPDAPPGFPRQMQPDAPPGFPRQTQPDAPPGFPRLNSTLTLKRPPVKIFLKKVRRPLISHLPQIFSPTLKQRNESSVTIFKDQDFPRKAVGQSHNFVNHSPRTSIGAFTENEKQVCSPSSKALYGLEDVKEEDSHLQSMSPKSPCHKVVTNNSCKNAASKTWIRHSRWPLFPLSKVVEEKQNSPEKLKEMQYAEGVLPCQTEINVSEIPGLVGIVAEESQETNTEKQIADSPLKSKESKQSTMVEKCGNESSVNDKLSLVSMEYDKISSSNAEGAVLTLQQQNHTIFGEDIVKDDGKKSEVENQVSRNFDSLLANTEEKTSSPCPLSLFPLDPLTQIEKASTAKQMVSLELTLSRPWYANDRNNWILLDNIIPLDKEN